MTLRTRFLITALWLCHQQLAGALVTSELLTANSTPDEGFPTQDTSGKSAAPASDTPCANRATSVLKDGTIICAVQQEKDSEIYKLHGDAEIHYRDYVLRADDVTYNSDTGDATASGHFTLDGGPNDDHIKASHGTYNLTAETGRFFDVTASARSWPDLM